MEQLIQNIDKGLCALEQIIVRNDALAAKRKKFAFLQIEINRTLQRAVQNDVSNRYHYDIDQKKTKFYSIIEAAIECLGDNICSITDNLDKMNEITPLVPKGNFIKSTANTIGEEGECSDILLEFYTYQRMKSNAINMPLNEVSMPIARMEAFVIFKDKTNIIIGIVLLLFITLILLDIYYRVSTHYHYNQF